MKIASMLESCSNALLKEMAIELKNPEWLKEIFNYKEEVVYTVVKNDDGEWRISNIKD